MTYLDVCCAWTVPGHQACQNKSERNHKTVFLRPSYPASDLPPALPQADVATHSPF